MRYRRVTGVLSEVTPSGALVSSPEGTEVLTLNATGTAVWEALGDEGDPARIAARLRARWPDRPADELEADVRTFLDQLVADGVAEPATESG